jgi:beta-xylosidase
MAEAVGSLFGEPSGCRWTRVGVALGMAVRRAWAGIAAIVGIVVALSVPAYGRSASFSAPVYGGDFPDPSILFVNGTYWAYSTGSAGRNLQVMSSTDLQGWTQPTDPLPKLPPWASPGLTWAPGVLPRGGNFVLYYTVHDPSLGHQCISVATSTSPGGPFVDNSASSGPLICQPADGGSIDPNPYVDPASGNVYLLWKSDDNSLGPGHPTHIWAEQLTADGLSLAPRTTPSLLLTQSAPWQSPAIEGPTMVSSAGRYYLFYGANNYDSAGSGIGYATSTSVLGSFSNRSTFGPWLGIRGNAQGAQGPCVFTDSTGVTRLAFAAWYGTVAYENGGVRSLWIGTLGFSRLGTPSLT